MSILPGDLGVAEHAQDVVAELEGLAEGDAVPGQAGQQLVGAAPQDGPDLERRLHRVAAGLEDRDPPGLGLVGRPSVGGQHVQELSGHHLHPHPVVPSEGRQEPVAGEPRSHQGPVGQDQGHVAGQDGGGQPVRSGIAHPPGPAMDLGQVQPRGGRAPPGGRPIHHIVVHDGERVQELQG
jgi:hypothetical protein